VSSLLSEMDRIANSTNYNGTQLLNGQSAKSVLEFQVGIRNQEADRIQFKVNENDVRASSLGVDGLDFGSIDNARESMDKIDSAMNKVFGARATLGAMQNKMHSTIGSIQIAKENLAQARSRIADTDIAAETSELVRGNILQSAGVSVLAQANQAPMAALKLL
jgi:flagellin